MVRFIDKGHIPGPVFIPNVAAVRLIWDLPNGKQASNILHGKGNPVIFTTQESMNDLYTSISTAFVASGLVAQINAGCELRAVGCRDLTEITPGVGHGELMSSVAATPGTGGGDALPANVSFVVSLKTGLRGQANRGRVYLPGWDELANAPGGSATDTAKNAAVNFIERVKSAFEASGLILSIAHPARAAYDGSTGSAHPARGATSVPVTGIVALNNVWDSTRLRSMR